MPFSVVIITKNEAHIIEQTLQRLQGISDDIILVDSGSTDGTQAIGKKYNTTIIETNWDGYGATKNKGNAAAENAWILSIDADEAVDEELKAALKEADLQNDNVVYQIKRNSFFCGKRIHFGEWAGDTVLRLFNRNRVHWNDAAVHETLVMSDDAKIVLLKGSLSHYTVHSVEEYKEKTLRYAKLSAEKYFAQGKKTNFLKIYIAPAFTFLQHYIFRLGFLDGTAGFIIAKTTAWYTHLKYFYLNKLNTRKQ
jgi:glycosyltransferase involved in cell wall biosynthesis